METVSPSTFFGYCNPSERSALLLVKELLAIWKATGRKVAVDCMVVTLRDIWQGIYFHGRPSLDVYECLIPLEDDNAAFPFWFIVIIDRQIRQKITPAQPAIKTALSCSCYFRFQYFVALIDETHQRGVRVCLRGADTCAHLRLMLGLKLDYIPSNLLTPEAARQVGSPSARDMPSGGEKGIVISEKIS